MVVMAACPFGMEGMGGDASGRRVGAQPSRRRRFAPVAEGAKARPVGTFGLAVSTMVPPRAAPQDPRRPDRAKTGPGVETTAHRGRDREWRRREQHVSWRFNFNWTPH